MSDQKDIIEFKWPWTMMPLEIADEWIEEIKRGLKKSEPIYKKDIFPSARKEDENLILLDIDTDSTYAIVNFAPNGQGGLTCSVVEILPNRKALKERLHKDHIDAISKTKQYG
jgi:hypothetical protein